MIHIIEIIVHNRNRWGDVITKDIALPAKIKKINGVMANVTLGGKSYLERLTYTTYDINKWKVAMDNSLSSQIGVFSLSVNNAGIINTNTPLCAISELRNPSYSKNLITIDGGLRVRGGSMARVVIEEKLESPFITNAKLDAIAKDLMLNANIEAQYESADDLALELAQMYDPSVGKYNKPDFRNNYIVKIYIDYDK